MASTGFSLCASSTTRSSFFVPLCTSVYFCVFTDLIPGRDGWSFTYCFNSTTKLYRSRPSFIFPNSLAGANFCKSVKILLNVSSSPWARVKNLILSQYYVPSRRSNISNKSYLSSLLSTSRFISHVNVLNISLPISPVSSKNTGNIFLSPT